MWAMSAADPEEAILEKLASPVRVRAPERAPLGSVKTTIALVTCAVLLLAGCGGSTRSVSATVPASSPNPTASVTSPAQEAAQATANACAAESSR